MKQRYSTSDKKNELYELPRYSNKTNLDWLERAFIELRKKKEDSEWSYILLLGSKDIAAFRVRVSQSLLRSDRLPSYWSDCGLLKVDHNKFVDSRFINLPLLQPSTEIYAPKRNGLIDLSLNEFLIWKNFPNMALLGIPVAQEKISTVLETYKNSHIAYDAVENIIPWLAYVWGVRETANPLTQQIGFPSAMLLNHLYSSQNFDLSPSVNSNLSSPEVFWNGVKNWTTFYKSGGAGKKESAPEGYFLINHSYDIDEK